MERFFPNRKTQNKLSLVLNEPHCETCFCRGTPVNSLDGFKQACEGKLFSINFRNIICNKTKSYDELNGPIVLTCINVIHDALNAEGESTLMTRHLFPWKDISLSDLSGTFAALLFQLKVSFKYCFLLPNRSCICSLFSIVERMRWQIEHSPGSQQQLLV